MRTASSWIYCVAILAIILVVQGVAQERTSGAAEASSAESKLIPPTPVYMVHPVFPESKKTRQGQITLRATVAADGSTKDISIVEGEPSLAELAVAAVRKWRYVPAIRSGLFVESVQQISISYRLGRDLSRPAEPTSTVARTPKEDLLAEIASGSLHKSLDFGVSAPKPLRAPDPEYSEVARREQFSGTLLLGVIVGSDGKPDDVWVVRPLGYGLDEKAVDAVKRWVFAPAKKNGNPVPVLLNVETSFELFGKGHEPEFEYVVRGVK